MVAGMIKLKYWSHIVRIVNIAVQITATAIWNGVLISLMRFPNKDSTQPALAYMPLK